MPQLSTFDLINQMPNACNTLSNVFFQLKRSIFETLSIRLCRCTVHTWRLARCGGRRVGR